MHAAAEYIREAIRRGQYGEALAQWNDYARQLRHATEAGTLAPDQMEEARRLYEWARPLLLGGRAQLRQRVRELEVAAAYRQCPEKRPSRIDARL
ncbi:MAG TPA: hypothetical protein VKT49_16880 [Bryobacteraceae bacterium]|nr:hypothetical protein [Bryobacteraceae bacterium]